MGSEQSSQGSGRQEGRGSRSQLRRGKSVPEPNRPESESVESSRPGSCSPGLSVCSDSDLPYISYTVNRPIGDSPKLSTKHGGHLMRGKSLGAAGSIILSQSKKVAFNKKSAPKTSTHNIVVVKPAANEETSDKDPDLIKLQNIPMFLPIMRGTANLPAARDPEVLERLDPTALYRLCIRCQRHMNECAVQATEEQNKITQRVKEVDMEIQKLLTSFADKWKAYQKHSEVLSRTHELSSQIGKCHYALNKTLELVENLNNQLPIEERLEPFVWTTG